MYVIVTVDAGLINRAKTQLHGSRCMSEGSLTTVICRLVAFLKLCVDIPQPITTKDLCEYYLLTVLLDVREIWRSCAGGRDKLNYGS